jgi:hypothetical protein
MNETDGHCKDQMTEPITTKQCNPQGKGCVALAEAKAEVIEERTELLTALSEKMDRKAYFTDVKEITDKIDRLKTLVITTLVTVVGLLIGVLGNIFLNFLAQ